MSAVRLLFLSAILTTIIPDAYAGLREISISDRSSVSERTMKSILESCYDGDDGVSDAVVVLGDFNEFTDKLSMIRMNLKTIHRHPSSNIKTLKPTRVIIVVDSMAQLKAYIKLLKSLAWWNHMASFFIISKEKISCFNLRDIYYLTVDVNMINSIYICPESMNTSVLYTSNRYSDYAPHPWRIVKRRGEVFLFSQRFEKNVSCSSLSYDKTKKLDRHTIRVLAWSAPQYYFNPRINYWPILSATEFLPKIFNTVSGVLNGSCDLHIRVGRDSTLELLHEGVGDLMYNAVGIGEYPTMKFLFPLHDSRIVAIIKSSSEQSTQSKIFHLWQPCVIFVAFTALVILFLILLLKNREFSSALLDVIRLIIYSSILTNIRSHSFRIFFTTILIMMIISNGVFQSKIAAFLTTRERNRPIERIETLVQLGYKLYSTRGVERIIQLYCPECNTIKVDSEECINHVLEDELSACFREELVYQVYSTLPLDLVKQPLVETFLVTKCRDDWPLYDRMNEMWMRVFESGLPNFWTTQRTYSSLRKRLAEDIERSSTQYQPIKLYKLLFAFKFRAIGLSFCTLVFIAELLVKKYRTPT